jgi:hypothetical protein
MRACLHSKGRRRRRNQRLSSSAAVWTVAIRRMGASARRSSIANPARGSRRSRRASWPPPGRQAWQSPSSADCRNDRHDRGGREASPSLRSQRFREEMLRDRETDCREEIRGLSDEERERLNTLIRAGKHPSRHSDARHSQHRSAATSPRVIDPEVAIADLSVAARLVEERTGPYHMTPP